MLSFQRGVIAPIILLILLLAGILVGVYLVQQKTNIFSKAFGKSAQQLTDELTTLNSSLSEGRFAQADEVIGKMIGVASLRKEKLVEEIENNPQEFLDHAVLTDKREGFPDLVKPFIEQEKQAEGTLVLVHSDNFKDLESKVYYSLEDDAGKVVATIYTAGEGKDIKSGDFISASGVDLAGKLVIRSPDDLEVLPPPQGRSAQGTDGYSSVGDEKVLVIPVNFAGNPSEATTKEKLKDKMDKISKYFQDSSYGRLNFQFEVSDWVTIAGNPNGCGWADSQHSNDDADEWARLIREQGTRQGLSLNQYNRFVYVFDRPEGCYKRGIAGYGDLVPQSYGGQSSWHEISESWIFSLKDADVFIHELGHNLGLGHANYLDCKGKSIDNFDNCQTKYYGDRYSVMGFYVPFVEEADQGVPEFNAPTKLLLGWLPKGQVRSVTKSGLYKITPLEKANSGVKAIILQKPDNPKHKYYLSYRQPPDTKFWTEKQIKEGLSIHIWDEDGKTGTYSTSNYFTFNTSWIIDASPDKSSGNYVRDPALVDNSSFYDHINRILVRQVSHDEESVTLDIRLNTDPVAIPTPTSLTDPLYAFQIILDADGQTAYSRRCPIKDSSNQAITWAECTNWLAEAADDITGRAGTRYTSIDSYVTTLDSADYLYLIFLEENGQAGTSMRCKVSKVSESGLSGNSCDEHTQLDFSTSRGLGGEKYIAVASYLVSENGQLFYKLSLVDESGQVGYARSCKVEDGAVVFSSCGKWQTVSFSNLRGLNNERYYSVTNFVLNRGDSSNLQQSLLDFNGTDGYFRNCPITTSGVTWAECTNWNLVPFGSLRGGTNETYKSITTYIIRAK